MSVDSADLHEFVEKWRRRMPWGNAADDYASSIIEKMLAELEEMMKG